MLDGGKMVYSAKPLIVRRNAIELCWEDPVYVEICRKMEELERQRDRLYDKYFEKARKEYGKK